MNAANDSASAARIEHCDATRSLYFAQARLKLDPASGAAWQSVAGGSISYSGANMPNCRAKGLGMHGPVTAQDIDLAEAFFAQHAVRPSFDVCPFAHRSLTELLGQRGYSLRKFYLTLALGLPVAVPALAQGIEVRPALPEEDRLWASLTGAGFNAGKPDAPDNFAIMLTNFHAANSHPYLAFIAGQAVGGGSFFLDGDTAELGGTSVLPEFRRRGVQTALIYRRLADAYAMGVTLAVLLTIPGANPQNNLDRAGFRVMYSKAVVNKG